MSIMLGELEHTDGRRDFGYCRHIKFGRFEGAMRKMSSDGAIRTDEIPMEFWKKVGRKALEWLTRLCNIIF